jgi:hypothetical protein
LRYIEADGKMLRSTVLLLLVHQVYELSFNERDRLPNDNRSLSLQMDQWSKTLQAQSNALGLLMADSPEAFWFEWESLRQYPGELRAQVSYFAERAERHLDELIRADPLPLDEATIREIKLGLREWGKQPA